MCGLLFLTEYSAGALILVAVFYAWFRFTGFRRWRAVGLVTGGFLLIVTPWIARNIAIAGHPVALAAQNVALKAGDPTAEPVAQRSTFSADQPKVELNKLANKVLTRIEENLTLELWSSGAMWFAAFFAAGWLYAFRSSAANRLRWVFTISLGVLIISQAVFNSGRASGSRRAGWRRW